MLASEWRGEEVPSSRKTTEVRSPSGGNHTASLNSRQVYASILDSQQAYGINGSKVRTSSLLTACSKTRFHGKVMGSGAAMK
jgi:hypothetical protein